LVGRRRKLRAGVATADWLVCARYNLPMTFRIGIISDTHGLLRPEAERRLVRVDHIIHGGDIGRLEIIDALRRIAPVTAIRGNVDIDDWALAYGETEVVRLAGKSIYALHDLKALQIDPIARGIDRRVRSFPCAENRHGRRRALPESRKRGPAALRAAHHTCDDRCNIGQRAAGNPRSRRGMNPSRGCVSLKRWQVSDRPVHDGRAAERPASRHIALGKPTLGRHPYGSWDLDLSPEV